MATESLMKVATLAQEDWVDEVVFGALVKETLHLGAKKYNDEREILKPLLQAPDMKSVAKNGDIFRVTIADYVPLRKVSGMIARQIGLTAIEILQETLLFYGLKSPRIAVVALNSNAGEGGLVGREEIDEITPATQEARTIRVV
ncbi:MAG: 4-hydroxythreonine-4-phosphate dehydrogenase PdxA [Dehalococcoidales bacterium]|jgi:4-hydroxythreonine-4-phosphate dehydrogenase|nr:hypothetical protein [Dehalococcoidales bacterium]MDP6043099.1 4-hydroxythreonine-4-phosphate dehydrogenase PdxA [Dehalococcoidales bacterium]MDP6576562.1 4-hydroxythreonine-4-phosphate dehydrogenase PdxA [Dehalococcoidales bacterium]MDP6824791.1 4-hydroxythreonine-4-phosphate dehydrogenase PdxA [Dehalococcoidales bacterium]MDP7285715.1 4-hydroxythreonine-4-phosphate dehydrogenase PdxA [Dehalococcoidales bacterium]|tara:strand:- start:377 stop:808 length:432 start_codon:yes stop_codon:yes gene_type:complete